jgi:hypothetical protein
MDGILQRMLFDIDINHGEGGTAKKEWNQS